MIVHLKISRSLESLSLLVWILCMLIILGHCAAAINSNFSCIAKERQALLSFKKGLIVHGNLLSSWDSEDLDCCNWIGIRCSKINGHVVSLDIGPRSMCKNITTCYWPNIKGEIGPSLLNLTHLNYLDLSCNDFTKIPEYLGSLNRLRYLNISNNDYLTVVPQHLGNLSALEYLDLSYNDDLKVETLEWLSHLSSLEYLNMNYVVLGSTRDCFQSITKLPLLRKLYLEYSYVSVPWSLKDFNSSKFLQEVYIEMGTLSSPAFYHWLNTSYSELTDLSLVDVGLQGPSPDFLRNMISLEYLDLSYNEFPGPIPKFLGDMSSLEHIDLLGNGLQGEIPKFFKNLCKLRILDLSWNKLIGSRDFFETMTGCIDNYHLQELHIDHNQLMGSLPSFSSFSSLEVLDISENNFNGSLKESLFSILSNLYFLDISSNSLEGVISEGHSSKLSNLKMLNLRNNSFTFKFRDDWVPPFQLEVLLLGPCKLPSHFPNWLRTQRSLRSLDISNSGISDTIPTWFWKISSQLRMLKLSDNSISGLAPNCSLCEVYDLSNNQFDGPLPQISSDIIILNLSGNKFSGSISFLCTQKFENLGYLDLSNNLFSDNLTDCRMSVRQLKMLNLENNSFIGELPSSLKNCAELQFLSLAQNQLCGEIPTWIGASLTNLMVLQLKSNKFRGGLPSNLCHLQFIQILDISMNSISGTIPSCLNNLTCLTAEGGGRGITGFSFSFGTTSFGTDSDLFYLSDLWVKWKGKMLKFTTKTVPSLNYIDLSSNKLSGEIPKELTSLSRLDSLSLSRNNLTGTIPANIGHLGQIDSLDLSNNHLSGRIPESITNLSLLSFLDLSCNNLSGPIPTDNHLQTFEEAFIGNPQLCGLPLKVECPVHSSTGEGTTGSHSSRVDHEQWYENKGTWVSVVLGFFVGFHGVCGPLLYSASWRKAYYQFLNKIKDGLWIFVVINIARLKRRFQQMM